MQDILIARIINKAFGGALIGPWDVRSLDNDTIELAKALTEDLPSLRTGQAKIEQVFAERRRSHPSYSKRLKRLN